MRPFQKEALEWISRGGDCVVDAAPGLGKTLPAMGALCQGAAQGAVLLLPLRVLVHERRAWFAAHRASLEARFGPLKVTTCLGGDPPDEGRGILLTTYEWYFHMGSRPRGVVVLDEGQELLSPTRGPLLERLLLRARLAPERPQVVITGAGLPDLRPLLGEFHLVRGHLSSHLKVTFLTPKKPKNQQVIRLLQSLLVAPPPGGAKVLVFVSLVRSTTALQRCIKGVLPELPLLVYHAGVPSEEREKLEIALSREGSLVVVSTSALAKGVDLPFTHVILRDLTLPGRPPLSLQEVEQLAGRCGRRGIPGKVWVLGHPRPHPHQPKWTPHVALYTLLRQRPLNWERISGILAPLLGREGSAQLSLALHEGVELRLLTRGGGGVYRTTLLGEYLLGLPLPFSGLVRALGLLQELHRAGVLNSLTHFDYALIYATLFPTETLDGGGALPPSWLWEHQITPNGWQVFFNSLGLSEHSPKGDGAKERLLKRALGLFRAGETTPSRSPPFSSLCKLGMLLAAPLGGSEGEKGGEDGVEVR